MLYKDEETSDSIAHFCNDNVKPAREEGYQGDEPTCAREITMFFMMTYPELL